MKKHLVDSNILFIFVMQTSKIKTMKNLKLLQINLQQTLVYKDENTYNAIHAIHDKYKGIVVVRVEYYKMTNEIKELLMVVGLECKDVIFGDGFGCDTWDNKIKTFTHKE
jgi:hypothetical protein